MDGEVEAERLFLGQILLDSSQFEDFLSFLSAEDFTNSERLIFETILKLNQASEPISLPTVASALSGRVKASFLAGLCDEAVSAATVEHTAKQIKRFSTLRKLRELGEKIRSDLETPLDLDVPKYLVETEQAVVSISDSSLRRSAPVSIDSHLRDYFCELEGLKERGDGLAGLSTGFRELDLITGGMKPAELVILAARPGHGKSALALAIAREIAQKETVLFVSIEMTKSQILHRLMAAASGIDLARLQTARLREGEWKTISDASQEISKLKLVLLDRGKMSPTDIRGEAMRLRRKQGLGLVVVDYLQLIRIKNKANREQEVSEISWSLKALAKDAGVPVLALAQLNREVESRRPPIPHISDLRESGSLEQDADTVLLLYRPDAYENDRDKWTREATLHIAKQRQGPQGSVNLRFTAEKCLFESCYYVYQQNNCIGY